ncbi:MAG: hypothetical protein RMM58_00070 [Chloroflexota bacterium]|nr:hypothetical protein [Dehalococcoidia bacterium]MDW8252257.1 hypothetical protein [Chloroflexota bacterium]
MEQSGPFEEQLRQLGAAIDRLVAQARAALEEREPGLHARVEDARRRIAALRDEVNGRWEAAKPAIERALREIEAALAALASGRPAAASSPQPEHREIVVRPEALSPPPATPPSAANE